jgi:ribosomal protein L11 methyltransferase
MYLELTFNLNEPITENGEIVAALLNDLNYETVQDEGLIKAYKPGEEYSLKGIKAELTSLLDLGLCAPKYVQKIIEKSNWNKVWESNFNPVEINGICHIRANFHEPINDGLMEIVITPKMSFGTGHHATTALMIEALDELTLTNLRCLDMGTGTGILAIFSIKKGAHSVLAIDNDEWCATNTLENITINKVADKIDVVHGDAYHLDQESKFDLIIANINRNILMADMDTYVHKLKKGGTILFSGFHQEDVALLESHANELGLKLDRSAERDTWVCLRFIKV